MRGSEVFARTRLVGPSAVPCRAVLWRIHPALCRHLTATRRRSGSLLLRATSSSQSRPRESSYSRRSFGHSGCAISTCFVAVSGRLATRERTMSVESAAALHPAASPLRRAVKDILAGTAGGIGLTLVGHPFDTLKGQPCIRTARPSSQSPHRCSLVQLRALPTDHTQPEQLTTTSQGSRTALSNASLTTFTAVCVRCASSPPDPVSHQPHLLLPP